MTTDLRNRVVVGIDGSDTSDLALDWAVDEARRRNLPLHLVHARDVDDWWRLARMPVPTELRDAPDPMLQERVERARGHPATPLRVTAESSVTHPSRALIERSEDAAVVVLGARGHGPAAQALVGSVSAQVSAHAHCPVVIVRQPITTHILSRVVVGVDGSDCSKSAVAYAFEQAASREVGLTAVHALTEPPGDELVSRRIALHQRRATMRERRTRIFGVLADLGDRYPQVDVRDCIRLDAPAKALIDESDRAELLVVGSRGLGGFAGLLLGSVSRAVLARSACPVAVVRSRQETRPSMTLAPDGSVE